MRSVIHFSLVLLVTTLVSACASLPTNYEKPQVSVTSFAISPESQGTLTFDIGLRVINPNSVALPLRGMTYTVDIEDNRILTGVASDLPKIAAYETAAFVIQATPDLLGGIRLLNQVLTGEQSRYGYRLNAQLDVGALFPLIHVEETGEFGY